MKMESPFSTGKTLVENDEKHLRPYFRVHAYTSSPNESFLQKGFTFFEIYKNKLHRKKRLKEDRGQKRKSFQFQIKDYFGSWLTKANWV